jgi:pyrroloquinoline quinone biosynthesis protein D
MTTETRSQTTWHPRLVDWAMLRHDPVRDVAMLLVPESAVTLNPTGAAILGLCDGERSVADITGELESRFGRHGLEAAIRAFLERVLEQGWVT